jgi:hypothetical protein
MQFINISNALILSPMIDSSSDAIELIIVRERRLELNEVSPA